MSGRFVALKLVGGVLYDAFRERVEVVRVLPDEAAYGAVLRVYFHFGRLYARHGQVEFDEGGFERYGRVESLQVGFHLRYARGVFLHDHARRFASELGFLRVQFLRYVVYARVDAFEQQLAYVAERHAGDALVYLRECDFL